MSNFDYNFLKNVQAFEEKGKNKIDVIKFLDGELIVIPRGDVEPGTFYIQDNLPDDNIILD